MAFLIEGLTSVGCATSPTIPSRQMPDGKRWMTRNLDVESVPSRCYADAEVNCRRFGRLYTWEAAREACESLGRGWRLPTDDDWRQMARHYGGVREDSEDEGRAAYGALMTGGRSWFDASLGGGRVPGEGGYSRLEAHGFYWTASESGRATAWFYNFGQGGLSLNRQGGGDKEMAISVRCVMD
jgi:uncharacterized protein (TIGR02145 family)